MLDAALAANPQSLPLINVLTELKVDEGNFAAAKDLCRQTLAKDPANYRARNNLGLLLALSGDNLDEALSLVNRAIELAGPLPLLLDSRAVVHIARHEPQQALDDLSAIGGEKTDPVWLFHKARA